MGLLFEITCKLQKKIRISVEHWEHISQIKHPEVHGLVEEVQETLTEPAEIKKSNTDKNVYLYYSKQGKYFLCVVTRHLNDHGFVITSYVTSKIKQGEIVWKQ